MNPNNVNPKTFWTHPDEYSNWSPTPMENPNYIVFFKFDSTFSPVYFSDDVVKTTFDITANKVLLGNLLLFINSNHSQNSTQFTLSWNEDGKKRSVTFALSDGSYDDWHGKDELFKNAVVPLVEHAVKVHDYPPQVHQWMLEKAKSMLSPNYQTPAHFDAISLYSAAPVKKENPNTPDRLARELPGISTKVELPCEDDCTYRNREQVTIRNAVIHLNDRHEWTREQIADWLELLQERDGIDLTFKVDVDKVEDEPDPPKYKSPDKFPEGWKEIGYTTEPVINKPDDWMIL